MADDLIPIELVDDTGSVQPATVFVSETPTGELCVTLRWAGGELSASAQDAFTAFCMVRVRLVDFRLLPRCFGACRNLGLSSMAYQMGRGLKGYLVRLGEPARLADLVRIFDKRPDMDLATVAEQKEFKQRWLRSLGTRPAGS